MTGILLFGVGSTLVVDVEESLYRAGIPIVAAIHNAETNHLAETVRVLAPDAVDATLLSLPFLVPLFTPGHRLAAAREAARLGLRHPFSLIDPGVAAPRRLELGGGSYVNTGCSLGAASRFGRYVLINRGASIGHHCRFGDFVSIGPGAVVAGHVSIGTGGMVGAGATVLPEVTLGANVVIGAGAVVTRDVPDGCLVLGNPARVVRRDIGGYKGLAVTAADVETVP